MNPQRMPRTPTPSRVRLRLRRGARFEAAGGAGGELEPKDALLLAYLAVEGPTPRARLAALLWPDADDERARGNLRQRLLRLRKSAGVELVTGGSLAQLAADVAHDLADGHEVLEAIGEEEAGGLAEWLDTQRQRRRRSRAGALTAQADEAEARGDLRTALERAHAVVGLDAISEEAHRRAMRLHYLAGDTAAALAAYDRCVLQLRAELGVAPSAETRRLKAQIESATVPVPVPVPVRDGAIPVTVLRPPRLVGRDAEWSAMAAAWDAGDPVFVLGEAGLGKSRLVGDFAHARGGVLPLSARPGDERVVYAVVTRLLRQLPREALRELDAPLRRELARLLPEFGEAAPLQSDAERVRFFNAIAAVLHAMPQRVAGVVVDDLHFADEASVELLQYLAGDTAIRWIFAGRPAELGAAARSLLDAVRTRAPAAVLDLAPLTLPQLEAFVASLDLPGIDAAAKADTLMRQTGGNPLFVLEVIKGWLTNADAAGGARLPALPGVGALIARRIGHLSPEAVRLARCAAVAGQDFSAAVAGQALGVRPLDLADAWAELEAAQVFRDGAFAHDLIRDAALASVPAPIARELHRELAQCLDERGGAPARLAWHWLAAGQWDRAGRALSAAAEQSAAACRWREAADQLGEAARCFERVGDGAARFEALYWRTKALVYCGLGDETIACARAANDAGTTDAQRLRGGLALLEVLAHRGDVGEVLAVGEPALARVRANGDREGELRLAIRMSGSLAGTQRAADALALLVPLQKWADAGAAPGDRCEYYLALGFALDFDGRLTEAARALETALSIAREGDDISAVADTLSNLATANAKLGRIRRAAELAAQSVAMMQGEGGTRGKLLQTQALHAHRLRDLGCYAEALPLFERALEHFRSAGAHAWVSSVGHRLALTWLQLGQFAHAQRLLADDPGDRTPRSEAMWETSLAELARLATPARPAEAQARIRRALDLLHEWPEDGTYRVVTLFATAIVAADEGEPLATDLAAWASARERFGLALGAHVRAAACALAQGAPRRALPHVEAALRLAPDYETDSMYRGELWLVAARAYDAVAERALALRMVTQGCAWVQDTAERHVPREFRDSFLHRNAVNRELFELARRLRQRRRSPAAS